MVRSRSQPGRYFTDEIDLADRLQDLFKVSGVKHVTDLYSESALVVLLRAVTTDFHVFLLWTLIGIREFLLAAKYCFVP
jgi:hypothetical protein